jgi:IrrE N-terminal-like domain
MNTYKTHKGPFKERPYFTDQEIETTCADELRAVGLLPSTPSPVRIDRFIEKRFGIVPSYEDLGDGILGLTRFGKRGVEEIVVSKSLEEAETIVAERRIRSTLAHEGGHGIFHTYLFSLGAKEKPLFGDFSDPNAPKVLCRDEGATYNGQWWEFQANRAIGALLLPRTLVEVALAVFLVPAGMMGLKVFDETRSAEAIALLVETFDVNLAVARIRIQQVFPAPATGQFTL